MFFGKSQGHACWSVGPAGSRTACEKKRKDDAHRHGWRWRPCFEYVGPQQCCSEREEDSDKDNNDCTPA
ncbi:hypothetical protein Cst04h_11870 [Corynebacterium striatum]|uniref:Uncharacterized protein n=1 Tax=Corynebacterium striatum TaxID=43770 RepID=A0ABC9ZLE1_CORST|nr:hypothetical protein Cst04h_11870 [Corynebacterium striatum]GKH16326.1 hypothetical protein CE91St29_06390 [Corynebacterium striatum]